MVEKAKQKIWEVERAGAKIQIPEKCPIEDAILALQKRAAYENEDVVISEAIHDVFVWDGALALMEGLEIVFGMALQQTEVVEMAGRKLKIPPRLISIETGLDETTKVPWGQFMLPGIDDGYVECGVQRDNKGRFIFVVNAKVKHKNEEMIGKLIDVTRRIAKTKSIYKGKAISIRFTNDDGDQLQLPSPRFMRLPDVNVIFKKSLQDAIDSNILALIRHTDEVRQMGTPLKRGILFGGPYGTGKTLSATMVAKECLNNGWTFIYCEKIEELPDVLAMAQFYYPVVVFGEDIDRVVGIERTEEVNKILNTLDGINSKSDEIITIITTNHVEKINDAMRRPGRIDRAFEIGPPDAEAVERLIRHYGRGTVAENTDLTGVGKLLDGKIAAVIREVVEAAKLSALWRSNGKSSLVLAQDLEIAATTYLEERLAFGQAKEPEDTAARLLRKLLDETVGDMRDQIKEIHQHY